MKTIIGLVGPSGVGKGYAKEAIKLSKPGFYVEPTVVTTRSKRTTDGADRESGVSITDFNTRVKNGEIIFDHPLYGSMYGFKAAQFESFRRSQTGALLTEVHVDNVPSFKERFGSDLLLIGLVADREYLASNLDQRSTETDEEKARRLEESLLEVEAIRTFGTQGLIDQIVEVNLQNRAIFAQTIIELINQ